MLKYDRKTARSPGFIVLGAIFLAIGGNLGDNEGREPANWCTAADGNVRETCDADAPSPRKVEKEKPVATKPADDEPEDECCDNDFPGWDGDTIRLPS